MQSLVNKQFPDVKTLVDVVAGFVQIEVQRAKQRRRLFFDFLVVRLDDDFPERLETGQTLELVHGVVAFEVVHRLQFSVAETKVLFESLETAVRY